MRTEDRTEPRRTTGKRLSEIESAARDRFLDEAEAATSGGARASARRRRRGTGYHVPTPVALVFMFFIGVGATGATLYWMGAVDTARETSLSAQLLASQAATVAATERLNRVEAERIGEEAQALAQRRLEWKQRLATLVSTYAERARELDRQAIADEPEEAVLTIWLLRQILTASHDDLDDTPELLERYGQSRDSVMRELIGLTYPELPLADALRAIEQSAANNEESHNGNSG